MSENKDFFERKDSRKVDLPEHEDYDPSNFDNDMHACGITDINGFKERHKKLFKNLIVDSNNENPVATVTESIEKAFTKREIAFLLSKDLLQTAYKESIEQLKQK